MPARLKGGEGRYHEKNTRKEKVLKKEVIFGEARGVHNGCRPEWTPSFLYDLKNSRVRLPSGWA